MTESALGPALPGLTNMASDSDRPEVIMAVIGRTQAEGAEPGQGEALGDQGRNRGSTGSFEASKA